MKQNLIEINGENNKLEIRSNIELKNVVIKLSGNNNKIVIKENSKLKDAGILQIVKLRLANTQLAQKKYDEALKTLAGVTEPAFKVTAEEEKGHIYLDKNDIENAKKSYQAAWDSLLERKQERQILQIKLESVGILVDDPELERPVLETQVDES